MRQGRGPLIAAVDWGASVFSGTSKGTSLLQGKVVGLSRISRAQRRHSFAGGVVTPLGRSLGAAMPKMNPLFSSRPFSTRLGDDDVQQSDILSEAIRTGASDDVINDILEDAPESTINYQGGLGTYDRPIFHAIGAGNEELVMRLIDKGADCRGVLHKLALLNPWDDRWESVVARVAAKEEINIDDGFATTTVSALQVAASEGNLPMVKLLHELGANLNVSDKTYGVTPLMNAFIKGNGDEELVAYFVANGADLSAKTKADIKIADYLGGELIVKAGCSLSDIAKYRGASPDVIALISDAKNRIFYQKNFFDLEVKDDVLAKELLSADGQKKFLDDVTKGLELRSLAAILNERKNNRIPYPEDASDEVKLFARVVDETSSSSPALALLSAFKNSEEKAKNINQALDYLSEEKIATMFFESLVLNNSTLGSANFGEILKEYLAVGCDDERRENILGFINFWTKFHEEVAHEIPSGDNLFKHALALGKGSEAALEIVARANINEGRDFEIINFLLQGDEIGPEKIAIIDDIVANIEDDVARKKLQCEILFSAIENGHLAMVSHVIQDWQIDVNSVFDGQGVTPLIFAALCDKEDIFSYLIEVGSDVSYRLPADAEVVCFKNDDLGQRRNFIVEIAAGLGVEDIVKSLSNKRLLDLLPSSAGKVVLTEKEERLLEKVVSLSSTPYQHEREESEYLEFFNKMGEVYASFIHTADEILLELHDDFTDLANDFTIDEGESFTIKLFADFCKSGNFSDASKLLYDFDDIANREQNFAMLDSLPSPKIAEIFCEMLLGYDGIAEIFCEMLLGYDGGEDLTKFAKIVSNYLDEHCEKTRKDDILEFVNFLSEHHCRINKKPEGELSHLLLNALEVLDHSDQFDSLKMMFDALEFDHCGIDASITNDRAGDKTWSFSNILALRGEYDVLKYMLNKDGLDNYLNCEGQNTAMILAEKGAPTELLLAVIYKASLATLQANKGRGDVFDAAASREDSLVIVEALARKGFDFGDRAILVGKKILDDFAIAGAERQCEIINNIAQGLEDELAAEKFKQEMISVATGKGYVDLLPKLALNWDIDLDNMSPATAVESASGQQGFSDKEQERDDGKSR